MYIKKLLICAFLFFICYLILSYLNKNLEAFVRGRGYYGRGFNRNFNRGYGYPLNRRNVYPVVLDNYPSYFYSLFY